MDQPDILFIVLDTQRADRLGIYGYPRPTSPHIDAFAGRGVIFEQAVAPAQWTIPSHASMFTGLYPTAHQVTQSSHSLGPDMPHLAELMATAGYETVGFCNNPLVGILNNGFRRGFETFYNYGGAIPSVPESSGRFPFPVGHLVDAYTQFLRRISYPIQNFFGRSDLAFRLSLNAWLTPLWSRFANFKGQNARSVQDVTAYLHRRERQGPRQPLFLFLNLMETHLPFWPPGRYVDRLAPYFRHSREARHVMRTWNREAYRWAAPLAHPLAALESQVLSDLYDAEVAYQDDYLGRLFEFLQSRQRQANTLTLMVADHGDGLGEHGYFGHAFVAYQELVHVPLIMHWPARLAPQRVPVPVSTRRVYHTMLGAAQPLPDAPGLNPGQARHLSLARTIAGQDPERQTAFSEVYPPMNFVRAIEGRQAHLLAPFRCLATRRAVVQATAEGAAHKLIEVDGQPDELFELAGDPAEAHDLRRQRPSLTASLERELAWLDGVVSRQRQRLPAGQQIDLEGNARLRQRLQGLGYIE